MQVADALAFAHMLAAESSPASMASMKLQVYAAFEQTLAESLVEANRLMAESFAGPDFGEGVRSFVEKREPQFAPVSVAHADQQAVG